MNQTTSLKKDDTPKPYTHFQRQRDIRGLHPKFSTIIDVCVASEEGKQ
jgi:hypothetical protein